MSLNQVDNRRAVAGNQGTLIIAGDRSVVPVRQEVNAHRTLVDFRKAKPLQAGDQLSRFDIMKRGRVRTSEHCDRRFGTGEQAAALDDAFGDHLSLLGADADTLATTDATLRNDLGVVAQNSDRFDRAVANTGVAFAARRLVGFDRNDSEISC